MKKQLLSLALLCFILNLNLAQSYQDVAILINTNSPESIEIGEYFQQKHAIPDNRVIELAMPTASTIDSSAAEAILIDYNVAMSSILGVNYLVTTKGCPKSIRTIEFEEPDHSFESILRTGSMTNLAFTPIDFEPGAFTREEFGFVIVSRLASKTLQGTLDLIDKGGQNVLNINDSLVFDIVTVEPAGSITDLMENSVNDWGATNADEIYPALKTDIAPSPYNVSNQNSGYFLFNFGLPDMNNPDLYEDLVNNSFGLATVITPMGALQDSIVADIDPYEFLETNNYAVIGAVDYAYFTKMRRLMDIYLHHYNLNDPYNIGESMALVEGNSVSSFMLFGDPKSTVSFISNNQEIENEFSFEVFPNPTHERLTLKFDAYNDLVDISIFTVDGRISKNFIRTANKLVELDLSDLPSGEYILNVRIENQSLNRIIVKQ